MASIAPKENAGGFPKKVASACLPCAVRMAARRAVMSASASSQLTGSNSPGPPTRRIGVVRRSGS